MDEDFARELPAAKIHEIAALPKFRESYKGVMFCTGCGTAKFISKGATVQEDWHYCEVHRMYEVSVRKCPRCDSIRRGGREAARLLKLAELGRSGHG